MDLSFALVRLPIDIQFWAQVADVPDQERALEVLQEHLTRPSLLTNIALDNLDLFVSSAFNRAMQSSNCLPLTDMTSSEWKLNASALAGTRAYISTAGTAPNSSNITVDIDAGSITVCASSWRLVRVHPQ